MDCLIYGVGSPILADVHATLDRLGWVVVAEVANLDGPSYARLSPITPQQRSERLSHLPIVIPLMTPGHRHAVWTEIRTADVDAVFPPAVDPTTPVASSTTIGDGVYVNAGGAVGGGTQIGAFAFLNRAASVGHHCVLEEFSVIGPGVTLAGTVSVGRGAFIGAGAVVLPGLTIGSNAVVGAGSVVVHDVPSNTIVVGNPARVVKDGIAGYNDVGV